MEHKQATTIFGATGKIGGELLRLLSDAHIPAIAVTRDISKAKDMPFVKWVQADMADKHSLTQTMEPGGSVFLLSGHSQSFLAEQANVINVAKANGVSYLLKLSSGAANSTSPLLIPRIHGEVEDLIKESGIAATFLRPNGFMQNWLGEVAGSVKSQRKIYEATGDGKRAYVDMRDIADVAYQILTDPITHVCHAYFLTGGEALNFEEIASLIGDALNENVQYVPLTIGKARERMQLKGMPQYVVDTLIAYMEDQRNGNTATVSSDIQDILGRPPRSATNFIKDHINLFQ